MWKGNNCYIVSFKNISVTFSTQIAYETAVRVKETFVQHSVTLMVSLPKQAIRIGLDKFHGGKKVCFASKVIVKKRR